MKNMHKSGVIFTGSSATVDYYDLLTPERIYRDVLVTNGEHKTAGDIYNRLYRWMNSCNIDTLWVHPDTNLSRYVLRSDFQAIEGLRWFSPTPEEQDDKVVHPYGLRLNNKYIFFPAYMDTMRTYRTAGGTLSSKQLSQGQRWNMDTPQTLLHTVEYIEQELGIPFLWSPGATALNLLRETHTKGDIYPFMDNAGLWKEISGQLVLRPVWKYHDRRSGQRGLNTSQKQQAFIVGVDKEKQFLTACIGLTVGNAECKTVPGSAFDDTSIGFWEYRITDVSKSLFTGYECYCPLSLKRTWASTELLVAARKFGITFDVIRGLVWKHSAKQALEKWAKRMWNAFMTIETRGYSDTVALANAKATFKKMYCDMIGRLTQEYSHEFYHPDWNYLIIHRAITNQCWNIAKRVHDYTQAPVLVCNDSFYFLSDTQDPGGIWADILQYRGQPRGYNLIGAAPLSKSIIQGFEELSPDALEALVKQEMRDYGKA